MHAKPEDEPIVFEPEPPVTFEGSFVPSREEQMRLAGKILRQARESIGLALRLVEGGDAMDVTRAFTDLVEMKRAAQTAEGGESVRVMEGVFDGAECIASDGRAYAVPPNYASKSRLVEGDVLKLTIRSDGSFLFKQIHPVERSRLLGTLAFDPSSHGFVVRSEAGVHKVLSASVTFFRGAPGDRAAILLPKSGRSAWAAVEWIENEGAGLVA